MGAAQWEQIVESINLLFWPKHLKNQIVVLNNVIVALALINNCIRTRASSYLSVDCTVDQYDATSNDI
jgi:hypothetical protein